MSYHLLTYYTFFIKWTSIRNYRRNGKFGRYAMGVVRNTYLGLDCSLSYHLERTAFFWKGNFSMRWKNFDDHTKIYLCISTISSLSFYTIDYLVHRIVSIFRHVRAIGEIGNITRCFYRTLEGNLIIVKNNVIYLSKEKSSWDYILIAFSVHNTRLEQIAEFRNMDRFSDPNILCLFNWHWSITCTWILQ